MNPLTGQMIGPSLPPKHAAAATLPAYRRGNENCEFTPP